MPAVPGEFVVKVGNPDFCGRLNDGRSRSAGLLAGADLALVQELWAEEPGDEDPVWREFRELAGC